MIPLKLSLKNFMCYKDNVPEINFEGIEIACLCGENGHGKSALLDAITWAVWGRSRAKSDDDLVYLGQTDMQVTLEFSAQDERYRVIRKHSKGGARKRASATTLDLAILPEDSDDWRPLTGNTVSDTERKIKGIIRLDYDTFINSAYLRQGRADEFTSKPANKRKEVLSSILGLSFYEEIEARAKEHIKTLRETLSRIEGAAVEVESQLAKRPQLEAFSLELKKDIAQKTDALSAKQAELEKLNDAHTAFELKNSQLQERNRMLTQIYWEIERAQSDVAAHTKAVKEYELLLSQSAELLAGYQKLKDASALKDKLDVRLTTYHSLSQRAALLDRHIEAERSSIDSHIKVLSDRLQKMTLAVSRAEAVAAGIAEAQAQLAALVSKEKALAQQKTKIDSLTEEIADKRASNVQLRKEMEELKDKMDQLAKGEGSCPLCGTPLSEDRCEGILQSYQLEGEKRKAIFLANNTAVAKAQLELDSIKRTTMNDEADLRNKQTALQRKTALLEKERDEIAAARQEIEKTQRDLAGYQARLSSGDFARQQCDELAAVKKEIGLIGYDPAKHESLRQDVNRLKDYEARYEKLAKAEVALPLEKASLESSAQTLARWQKSLSDEEKHKARLSAEIAEFGNLKSKINSVREESRSIQSELDTSARHLAGVESELARLAELQAQAIAKEQERRQISEEISAYIEIAESAGKQGAQALIIESIVPLLESEANSLLARMTDNRMSLKLETQRDTKTGGLKETLDIHISDELGTRDYEMYSGGEAYRIDLAIRVALSRLLAQRAGAPLPVLFLDEGFGTQDTAGREKIADAINSISSEFKLVLVITHMEDLKEMFPVRIEVVKSNEGSLVTVS